MDLAIELSNLTLDEITFVYFDVETTGLSPLFGDRICEVAALRARRGEELLVYHSLVDPKRPISPGAFRVNQITDEMLMGAPSFGEIADELLITFDDSVLVAHNAPFDLGFLATELSMLGHPMPQIPVIDTLAIARSRYFFPSNSLINVARSLGLRMEQRHRALDDVRLTRQVLEIFLRDLKSDGFGTLGELIQAQGGSIQCPQVFAAPLPPPIQETLYRRGTLFIRYVDAGGEETERLVQPLRVYDGHDYIYLEAYCHLRQARRVFRLDRIVEMGALTNEPGTE